MQEPPTQVELLLRTIAEDQSRTRRAVERFGQRIMDACHMLVGILIVSYVIQFIANISGCGREPWNP